MKRFAVITILLAVTSCLSREFTEGTPYISVDTRQVVVPSDIDSGEVRDTLWVTSNRSWGAAFSDEESWVRLEEVGCENMAGVSKIAALPLVFENNSSYQDRSVELIICSGELTEKVIITQEAKSYRLSLVEAPDGVGDISSDGGTFEVSFLCNTDWTAKVNYNDGMSVSLSSENGNGPSAVTVTVKPNTDGEKGRNAVLRLSAEGCLDIDIMLVQQRRIPYFRLEGGNEIVMTPGMDNCPVVFKTNQNWTAEIISVENYDPADVSLSMTDGTLADKSISVNFPACVEFGKQGKILVEFVPEESAEPIRVCMTQEPAIRASFGPPITEDIWPFATPEFSELTKSSTTAIYVGQETEFVLKNGYSFNIFSTDGFWHNTATGFMGGGAAGDYIELPVVEGFRPVRIEYTCLGEIPIRCDVRSSDGRVLEESVFNASVEEVVSVDLKGTVASEAYRIVTQNTRPFSLGDLAVFYQ